MTRFNFPIRWMVFSLIGLTALTSLTLVVPGRAEEPDQQTEDYCLSCHNNPSLSMTLPSGETLSLHITPEVLNRSVHSPIGIGCKACHTDITTYPHPKINYTNHRELARALYMACEKCHRDNYDKTLDSMHAKAATAGNLDAPICTDCHGTHNIRPINEPRALISETCGKCHAKIFDLYKQSVHGSALIQQNNPDVPVCTDCHGVHNIQDPRTTQFQIDTPELCAGCHANQKLMSKYGLSADVYSIYKISWHGVDVSVFQARWPTIWHRSAVCTDCHGVHDMLSSSIPASRVSPQNLLVTCQKCHPGAGPNWTGAWTGHYKVSLKRTPFVFYTEAFYKYFTPFVLGVCLIYVILQIIRATAARAKRSLR